MFVQFDIVCFTTFDFFSLCEHGNANIAFANPLNSLIIIDLRDIQNTYENVVIRSRKLLKIIANIMIFIERERF